MSVVRVLVLSLLSQDKLLLMSPPFSGVQEVQVKYHFRNVPQQQTNNTGSWLPMQQCAVAGRPAFVSNLSRLQHDDDVFLFAQYRMVFQQGARESDWHMYMWNKDRLRCDGVVVVDSDFDYSIVTLMFMVIAYVIMLSHKVYLLVAAKRYRQLETMCSRREIYVHVDRL